MFTSYDKEKFIVGNEYYTYYFGVSNKGKSIIDYSGIMLVKVTSNSPTEYSPKGYTKFEIISSKPLSRTLQHNIPLYLHGYGLAFCNFFETYDDCVEYHDKHIISVGKRTDKFSREKMYKKLISVTPTKTTLEKTSIDWYENLSDVEKSYVIWLSENYTKIK
jgi:hypothetical protein